MNEEIEQIKQAVTGLQESQEFLLQMIEVVEEGLKSEMTQRFDALDSKLQTLIDDQKAFGRRVQDLEEEANE